MTTENNGSTNPGDSVNAPGEQTTTNQSEGAGNKGTPPPSEDGAQGVQGNDSLDESKLDDKTKAYLANLRKENAKYRTRSKNAETQLLETRKQITKLAGGKGDSENDAPPEVQIEQLSNHVAAVNFENALLSIAVENGIDGKGLSYFRFLMSEKTASLEENEEISQEEMAEIVSEVRAKTKAQIPTATSVGAGAGKAPIPGNDGSVTLDQFCAMSIVQKGDLYSKNKPLYEALTAQAIKANRLV